MNHQKVLPLEVTKYEFAYHLPNILLFTSACAGFATGLWCLMFWSISFVNEENFPWMMALPPILFILFGIFILFVNNSKKFRLKITEEGIYIPSLLGKVRFISFSSISDIKLSAVPGVFGLYLYADNKKYLLNSMWFSEKDDFGKIIEIINKKISIMM